MRIPRQEDFAILLMSELTRGYKNRLISISEVSKRHGVSALFLKKIVRMLRQHDLVDSREGAGGGYMLTRHPQNISVWEVMQAVSREKTLPLKGRGVCPLNNHCLPQHINKTIRQSIQHGLKDISLRQLIK